MDVNEVLRKAWLAVEESGVPPELYEVAFTAAIANLTETGAPHSAGCSPSPAPSATPQKAQLTAAAGAADARPSAIDPDAVYARLSAESGVEEAHIRGVLLIEDSGEVAILPPGRSLGSNTAERARNVASLLAGVYFGGFNKRSMPYEVVKKACEDRSCYDHKNLKSGHLTRHDALNLRGADVHINMSNWADSFTGALNVARGIAVE